MDAKVQELIGIAASVAAGCDSCLEDHVGAARREGADNREIRTAIQIARAVRLQAVTRIDDLSERLERGRTITLAATRGDGGCDCGDGCSC